MSLIRASDSAAVGVPGRDRFRGCVGGENSDIGTPEAPVSSPTGWWVDIPKDWVRDGTRLLPPRRWFADMSIDRFRDKRQDRGRRQGGSAALAPMRVSDVERRSLLEAVGGGGVPTLLSGGPAPGEHQAEQHSMAVRVPVVLGQRVVRAGVDLFRRGLHLASLDEVMELRARVDELERDF
jgi:hypothetical protein